MNLNWTIRGEEKLRAFIEENASISYEEALDDLKQQYLADESIKAYTLTADKSKDGSAVTKNFMAVSMSYDAQGTQLGAGKAYLDADKKVARQDITIVFM
jgi:hypothetical protein